MQLKIQTGEKPHKWNESGKSYSTHSVLNTYQKIYPQTLKSVISLEK